MDEKSAETTTKKKASKRGRPKGSKNKVTRKKAAKKTAKKTGKRGRPKGSKNKVTRKKAAKKTAKKTGERGRPKGSKNKTTKRKSRKVIGPYDLRVLKGLEIDDLITLSSKVESVIKAKKTKALAQLRKERARIASQIKALS